MSKDVLQPSLVYGGLLERNMTITIEGVVSQIPDWDGKTIEISVLSGGLTNTNYRVQVAGEPFFVRIPGESTELLAVNRENEYFNSKAAAEAGVGPRVFYHIPDHDVMVLEFIMGQTMSNEALNAPGMPTRIARSLKMLHRGPRFLTDFNMFRLTQFYLKLCKERSIKIPEGYPEYMPCIISIEEAVSVNPLPTVPCNNDLLAENYIDDGQLLRLIDFEYSGNNDPCFELGNTCQELGYDEARIRELCEAYFGKESAAMLARMKLNMIMSDVGWTLWAAIQANISKIDYDFWGWATDRWGRATVKMDSTDFNRWLEAVQTKEIE
jgi:thiamine kinase-like enzyme